MPAGDQDQARTRSRRNIQQPTILVIGLKPERLMDSEGRIDAFLEPPTQEQTETLVEAVRSGAEAGGHVLAIAPQWINGDGLLRLQMVESALDDERLTIHETFAAAILLAAPAVAGAQSSPPREPVVGGGSFASAPLLGSGRYRDTILPGERLYYGVRLQAGQRLRVRAKLEIAPGEIDTDTAAGFSIGLQTPLREVITDTDEDITGNSTVGSVEDDFNVIFPPAVAPSATRDGIGEYRGPGIWYPSLYLPSVLRKPAKVELPVELELEVVGDPQPDASPEPTPAEATPAPEPEGEEDGGGSSAGAVAGIGLLGLLVGLVGGGLAAARRT